MIREIFGPLVFAALDIRPKWLKSIFESIIDFLNIFDKNEFAKQSPNGGPVYALVTGNIDHVSQPDNYVFFLSGSVLTFLNKFTTTEKCGGGQNM